MMDFNPQILDDTEDYDEDGSSLSPLMPFSRTIRKSRTMIDLAQGDSLVDGSANLYSPKLVSQKRSIPQMRLQVSIPASSTSQENTPQSDSPETPASTLSSPIAGVVDLTKNITTVSKFAVAHGGLSDIYVGEWLRTTGNESASQKLTVAIKLLRILTKKDQDGARARKRLNREVYVWHRLEHPNVVKLYGTSYHMAGRPAMVMQWYKNGSAAEYLTKNPEADRLQLILDVACGLEYLHTHSPSVVHADLKGNNVLITDEGRAVLCDFGLSQVVEDLGRPTGFTLSNPDMGPVRWQAPEFLEGEDEPATLASDVWSFGCTAFELLTSSIPYGHRIRDAQVIRDMQQRIKPSGSTDATLQTIESGVKSLLDACWSFEPTERPTMSRMRVQLEVIIASRTTSDDL